MKLTLLLILSSVIHCHCIAQRNATSKVVDGYKNQTAENIQAHSDTYKKIALTIWDYAEVGYKEFKSSTLLQQTLKENGFTIEAGVAGIPTAFVATYGSGKPVIGMIAEFDALPGISQNNSPTRTPLENKNSGHACGHHLFFFFSATAGISIIYLMQEGKIRGPMKVIA